MGLFSPSASKQNAADALAPFNPPLGLDRAFTRDQQTVLTVKINGNDYSVVDGKGQDVIKCYGKDPTLPRQIVESKTGRHLFHIAGVKTVHWEDQCGRNVEGQAVFSISEARTPYTLYQSEVFLRFTNASTEKPVGLVLSLGPGPAGVLRYDLVYGERRVGWIVKETAMFSTTPFYRMTVSSGVDLALMGAFCICYDAIVTSRRTSAAAIGGAAGMMFVGGGGGDGGGGGG